MTLYRCGRRLCLRGARVWTMFSKRTQLSLSQVIDSDRPQQHSLFRADSSTIERDSHYFHPSTVPVLPKQVILSVYSFPQFHPTPFRRLPGIWGVKSKYRKTRLGQPGMVQASMFLSTSSFVTNAANRNPNNCPEPSMGLTRVHHNDSRYDLSISCVIRLLRKQGSNHSVQP